MLRNNGFSYKRIIACPLIKTEGVFHFHTLKKEKVMDLKMTDSAREEVTRKRETGFDRILDGLKVLSKSKPQPQLNPTHLRREKLISNIGNQLELIERPKSIYLRKVKRIGIGKDEGI